MPLHYDIDNTERIVTITGDYAETSEWRVLLAAIAEDPHYRRGLGFLRDLRASEHRSAPTRWIGIIAVVREFWDRLGATRAAILTRPGIDVPATVAHALAEDERSPCARSIPTTTPSPGWREADSRLETGDWRLATGDWRLETGDWRLETGDWRLETGDWRLETGDWRLETGDWRLATGNWRLVTSQCGRRNTDSGRREEEAWSGGNFSPAGAALSDVLLDPAEADLVGFRVGHLLFSILAPEMPSDQAASSTSATCETCEMPCRRCGNGSKRPGRREAAHIRATSEASAEGAQLRATVSALRDELERERARRDDAIGRPYAESSDEIRHLRATVATLREQLELERHSRQDAIGSAAAQSQDLDRAAQIHRRGV
jgi:hypothetical protein